MTTSILNKAFQLFSNRQKQKLGKSENNRRT